MPVFPQHLKNVAPLSSRLHSFWWEAVIFYFFPPPICNVSFASCLQDFFNVSRCVLCCYFVIFFFKYMSILILILKLLEFILSLICGKLLAIIFSNISSVSSHSRTPVSKILYWNSSTALRCSVLFSSLIMRVCFSLDNFCWCVFKFIDSFLSFVEFIIGAIEGLLNLS